MLNITLDEQTGIAIFEPNSALSKEDFALATEKVDSFLKKHKNLNGLIVHVKSIPGWDSMSAFKDHIHFIKQHHKKIKCIALTTDSKIVTFAESIAKSLVEAKIKSFKYDDIETAKKWIIDNT